MPTRPRSHVLEDISFAAFRAAVPSQWVVRERSRDYGIDLEVEIFDEEGKSTGLIFFAQVRATDDPKKGKKVRLDLDQVEYFHTIEIPTMVVRYCHAVKAIHTKWHFEIPPPRDRAKSLTLTFEDGDCWQAGTATKVVATLRTASRIRAAQPLSIVTIGIKNQSSGNRFGSFGHAVETLLDFECGLSLDAGPNQALAVEIAASDDEVVVAFDKLASIRFSGHGADGDEIFRQLSYCLVYLFHQIGLAGQAVRIARMLLEESVQGPSRALSARASIALSVDPLAAADLAISNGIHLIQDEHFAILIMTLHRSGTKRSRYEAISRIYDAAIAECGKSPNAGLASLHYSSANNYRANGNTLRAIYHYNRARKCSDVYNIEAYFWAELAGCLFMKGRWALAAHTYEKAVSLKPSQLLSLLRGDALMMAGHLTAAAEQFEAATIGDSRPIQLEAGLKASLCERLADQYGSTIARHRNAVSIEVARLEETPLKDWPWERIVAELDALDTLSNFNLARRELDDGNQEGALWRYLLVAVIQPKDTEAWFNALACAWPEPLLFAAILELSLRQNGRAPYALLRQQWAESPNSEDIVRSMDEVIEDISMEIAREGKSGATLRVFDGKRFREMAEFH